MQHSFHIGIQERHHVAVSFDSFWGRFEIRVDGILVKKEHLLFSFGITHHWDFWVGVHEKHFIRVEKTRPVFFAAFQPHTYRFFIDGVLVQQLQA